MSTELMIHFKSREGDVVPVPLEAAQIAELVKDAAESRADDDEDDSPLEIEAIKFSTSGLNKVVEFMKHYAEEPMTEIKTPLEGSTFSEIIEQPWYDTFLSEDDVETDLFFELLIAANFMGIKPLLDLACLKATFRIAGKDRHEIQRILRLPDMTPEEEEKARKEHAWIFED
eukprot:Nitzschia sp. Nitz4//scaffold207_size38617//32986//33657//NITZ4_007682-RA/size38617-augustus-gene-0.11-mRNA-1//1//CDS//3329541626//6408//frame0